MLSGLRGGVVILHVVVAIWVQKFRGRRILFLLRVFDWRKRCQNSSICLFGGKVFSVKIAFTCSSRMAVCSGMCD